MRNEERYYKMIWIGIIIAGIVLLFIWLRYEPYMKQVIGW